MSDVIGQGLPDAQRAHVQAAEPPVPANDASWVPPAPLERQGTRYRDPRALARCVELLESRAGIVSVDGIERLSAGLARAQAGEAFLLHAGDCAESFASAERRSVESRLRILWQLGCLIEDLLGVPVLRLGRMAGQYAKPRSNDVELVQGERLPVFRGENINGAEPTHEAREHRPERMIWGYTAALHTVQLLNDALALGTTSARLPEGGRAARLAEEHTLFAQIASHLACAGGPGPGAEVGREVFVSHEALLLPYEKALTRRAPGAMHAFNVGTHLLWLGERTRQPDGAHARYLASIANPIGVKLGPSATPAEVHELVRLLNPGALPGRLTLIARLGVGAVRRVLPGWIQAVRDTGIPVLWVCDPMHGNTFMTGTRVKVRRVEDVAEELAETLHVHRGLGSRLGGIHLEVAGEDVTECLGGLVGIHEGELGNRYETLCDPRLAPAQALEVIWGLKPRDGARRARSAPGEKVAR